MGKTSNQVVAITGASSGIGAALALEAARTGARVALMARRIDELEEVACQVRDQGGEALVIPLDVTDRAAVQTAFSQIADEWAVPDLVIANAGIGSPGSVRNLDVDVVDKVMQVNFFGVLYVAEACLDGMLERGSGRFAAVSSLAGWRGIPYAGAYSASKAALSSWMEAARIELRGSGVVLTTIHPGYVHTPMTAKNRFPMPFVMKADRASRIIWEGVQQGDSEVNFPLPTTALMRLARHLPNAIFDRAIGKRIG